MELVFIVVNAAAAFVIFFDLLKITDAWLENFTKHNCLAKTLLVFLTGVLPGGFAVWFATGGIDSVFDSLLKTVK